MSDNDYLLDRTTPPPRSHVVAAEPVVSVKTMRLGDGRADYFVSIKVGNREVTPHVFREEYKAAYHVALYSWLLNGTDKPDLMAFDEDEWPAQATEIVDRKYQDRVAAAHHALFHDDPTDIAERLARYAEETNEVLQAFGMSREFMHQLVDYTCDRPAGEPANEIGAALLTLTSLCVVAGYDVMACGEADLEKLQRPETIARIRAKRATRHGRGPLPGLDPSVSADAPKTTLTDGSPVTADHREINPATGMQKGYVVLSEAERAKGFVRPVRQTYTHLKCGAETKMGLSLAETYARDPSFYSGTYCVACRNHFPVGPEGEFVWTGTAEKVGS